MWLIRDNIAISINELDVMKVVGAEIYFYPKKQQEKEVHYTFSFADSDEAHTAFARIFACLTIKTAYIEL